MIVSSWKSSFTEISFTPIDQTPTSTGNITAASKATYKAHAGSSRSGKCPSYAMGLARYLMKNEISVQVITKHTANDVHCFLIYEEGDKRFLVDPTYKYFLVNKVPDKEVDQLSDVMICEITTLGDLNAVLEAHKLPKELWDVWTQII